ASFPSATPGEFIISWHCPERANPRASGIPQPSFQELASTLPRPVARGCALAGLLGLVALTLAHPSASRLLTWPWALLAAALWLQPLVAGQLLLGGSAVCRLPGRLVVAGLALLAASSLLSACLSPFSAASFARLFPTLGGVALFFWLHHWLSDP